MRSYRWTRCQLKKKGVVQGEDGGPKAIVPAFDAEIAELTLERPEGASAATAVVLELMKATTPNGPWFSLASPVSATFEAVAAPPGRVEGAYLGVFITNGEGADLLYDVGLVLRDRGGDWNPIEVTPPELSADVNDWAAFGAASLVRMHASAPITITGLAGGWAARRLRLQNTGGKEITLAHEHASSLAVNRMTSNTGADVTIAPDSFSELVYDATSRRWHLAG